MESLEKSLLRMTDFLTEYHTVVDTCMVAFILDDMFDVLPSEVGSELLQMSDEDLGSLPALLFRDRTVFYVLTFIFFKISKTKSRGRIRWEYFFPQRPVILSVCRCEQYNNCLYY